MSRILEGERVAEVEVRVLLSSLVIGTVSFQERNDLVEAGELHAILISMHVAHAERDPRVVWLDIIAFGVTIESDIREEQLDFATREDARRTRPLCLVTVGLVLENLAGDTLGENQTAIGPTTVFRTLFSRNARRTIEVADLCEHVTVIEAKTPVSNERKDNFLPVDTVLVTIGIGQRLGVPYPDLSVRHVREILRDARHGVFRRHRVLA